MDFFLIYLIKHSQMIMNESDIYLSFIPSSILIRFFMSWLWQQLSSISTGCPTCRSSAMASREDAQMTHYSEGPDCDLLILSFIAPQTHLKSCWNWIYSHLSLLLCFWFANILFVFWWTFCLALFCSSKVALTSHWTTEGTFNRHYVFNNYEAWSQVRSKWDFNQNLIFI